jgi:hypothetical protein
MVSKPSLAPIKEKAPVKKVIDHHVAKVVEIDSVKNKKARTEKLKVHSCCIVFGGTILVVIHVFYVFHGLEAIPGLTDAVPIGPSLVQEFFDWLYGL